MLVGRITIEILRPVPLAPLAVASRVVRPGRNVELVEASLVEAEARADRREIARAAAWRLRIDHGVAVSELEPPPPGPAAGRDQPFFATGQEIGYHTAMDYRFLAGAFTEPGPAIVWLRMRQPLVAGAGRPRGAVTLGRHDGPRRGDDTISAARHAAATGPTGWPAARLRVAASRPVFRVVANIGGAGRDPTPRASGASG